MCSRVAVAGDSRAGWYVRPVQESEGETSAGPRPRGRGASSRCRCRVNTRKEDETRARGGPSRSRRARTASSELSTCPIRQFPGLRASLPHAFRGARSSAAPALAPWGPFSRRPCVLPGPWGANGRRRGCAAPCTRRAWRRSHRAHPSRVVSGASPPSDWPMISYPLRFSTALNPRSCHIPTHADPLRPAQDH
jgi:hypothetical protein